MDGPQGYDALFANLRRADLLSSDLREASLDFADCTGAMLTDANLSGASLMRCNFSRATMGRTVLGNVQLGSSIGLEWVIHQDVSSVDLPTIYLSKGAIAHSFLKGTGVPQSFLDYMAAL